MRRQPDLLDLVMRDSADARDITVRSYAVRASSLDAKARSVDAVLATETPVLVFDMRSWSVIREILVVDGMTFADQVPLLDSHDRSSIKSQLGSTRNLRKEAGQLIGTRFFSTVDDADEAFTKIREGHLRDGSIGYRVTGFQDLQPGESMTTGGRAFKNDGTDVLRISYAVTVMEDSVTPIGADALAKVRSDTPPNPPPAPRAALPTTKERTMTIEELVAIYGEKHRSLMARMLADGKSVALIAQAVVTAERAEAETAVRAAPVNAGNPATAPPAIAPTPAAGADEGTRAAGIAAERKRVADIRTAAGTDIPAEVVERAISDGWDVSRANVEFLNQMRAGRVTEAQKIPVVVRTADNAQGLRNALEAAIAIRAGISQDTIKAFRVDGKMIEDPKAIIAAREFRGMGLHDLARLALRADGVQDIPVSPDELFARAVSTVSLPNILGNAVNRSLLASYEETPSTILEWAATDEVKDFRPAPTLRMGKFARPNKAGNGGEFDYQTLTEAKETRQAYTRGIWFGITREQWINDDLGAFARVPFELGMAMKRNIDDTGYELLVSSSGVGPTMNEDAKALFATNHTDGANYQTGNVLAAAGLAALKILMRKIKQGDVTLNLVPKVLIVPPELEFTAQQLVQSSTLVGSTTSDALMGTSNPHFGGLKVVVEPRLSAGTNGTTAWYLVCDWRQARSLVVSFLRGMSSPTIERRDPTATLGLGWLTYHDVGVDAVDFRGIARSRGA